jgi:RNA polymerase sigma factor (TIGR02999 family)
MFMSDGSGGILGDYQWDGAGAPAELPSPLYNQLRGLARSLLRGQPPGHTLQPTALVNEAYLKVFGAAEPQFAGRVHFLAVMARVMRQVLVDHARARAAAKRGGAKPLSLDDGALPASAAGEAAQADFLDLNRALTELEAVNPALARIVELHYFAGMTAEEIAPAVDRTAHAVRHDLRAARAWLRRELSK